MIVKMYIKTQHKIETPRHFGHHIAKLQINHQHCHSTREEEMASHLMKNAKRIGFTVIQMRWNSEKNSFEERAMLF